MGIPLEPRSPGMRMKFYVGLDGAEDLVLEFIDLVATRGQFDLVAGAKVSFDAADAILVTRGYTGGSLRFEQDTLRLHWVSRTCAQGNFASYHREPPLPPRNAVVYLAEDLDWNEELVSEVVAAMKDFTGHQRIKAGYSHMAGSPTLGYA